MRKKTLIILITVFITQTIISCCDCDSNTYENIYSSIEITPYDTSGFNNEVAKDNVYKNAFGLGIYVDYDSNIIANTTLTKLSDFGFSSALAFSCDCYIDYLYPDPISELKIYIKNQNTTEKIEVTDWFKIYSYYDGLTSLDNFFEKRELSNYQYQNDPFNLELTEHELIPNSVIFEVNIFLESGKILKNQTGIVNFIE